jgi:menaquinone-dependent protoporphyrinogen oxidase
MSRILIAYATVEGHTGHIAETMRDALAAEGHEPRLLHVRKHEDAVVPTDVEAVIVGGPIHGGHHPKELTAFAKANAARLSELPSGFFTVCLTALDDTDEAREATEGFTREFREASGWTPGRVAVFPGRLAWTQYDFFTRLIMKLITRHHGSTDQNAKRDYDYTDYDAVRAFAAEVAAAPTAVRT